MIEHLAVFAKQLLISGGMDASKLPRKTRQVLLTAFQELSSKEVVIFKPFLKLAKGSEGCLIIDDTSNPKYGLKEYCRKMKILTTGGFAQGFKVLLFLWENKQQRIPIGFALWHKGTRSLNELALHGFSLLRGRYRLKPTAVLADAAFCTDRALTLLEGYSWASIIDVGDAL